MLSDDSSVAGSLWTDMGNNEYKLDDYIIQPLDFANLSPLLNTINISGTGGGGTYAIGGGGSGGSSGLYNTTNPSHSWATLNATNKVNIHGNGINLDDDADISFGGRSLRKTLEAIEQRLSILVPDPKKLEHYEALRQAYEHYKTLEALCNEEPQQDKK